MRVNPNPLPDLIAAIRRPSSRSTPTWQRSRPDRSMNLPSDNPAGAAHAGAQCGPEREADQFLRSISSVQAELQNADSALNSVVTALQRAISLGVEGANGTLNSSDRQRSRSKSRDSVAIAQPGQPLLSGQLCVCGNRHPARALCARCHQPLRGALCGQLRA